MYFHNCHERNAVFPKSLSRHKIRRTHYLSRCFMILGILSFIAISFVAIYMLGFTPEERLRKAIKQKDVQAVEEVLNSNPDMINEFHYGYTPLQYAAGVSSSQVVQLLIDRGARASAHNCINSARQRVLRGDEQSSLRSVDSEPESHVIQLRNGTTCGRLRHVGSGGRASGESK